MITANVSRAWLTACIAVVLAGCGGGGGGSAPTPSYAIGGSISPFTGTLKLSNNGSETLSISGGAATFKFLTALLGGASYSVSITVQPPGQRCTVTNGSGTISTTAISSISIQCVPGTVTAVASFDPATVLNGSAPSAGLIQASDGNFYGTTTNGGANAVGTVFKVTPAGAVSTLYSFGTSASGDGQRPQAALLQASDGNLYGTTTGGGSLGNGTVFRVTLSGVETVLYSFGAAPDGSGPLAGLIQASDGNFYGTTSAGGGVSHGTLFKLTPAGTETVVHSFAGGADGAHPVSAVVQASDGSLYGSTDRGGSNDLGVLYQITAGGTETVLHSFGTAQDGQNPQSSLLIGADGALYGTFANGGANGTGGVFRFSQANGESILYSFGTAGGDGTFPLSGLTLASDGAFYAVTTHGGAHAAGALVRITTAGAESVLYSFGAPGDAQFPLCDLLLASNGVFYGTAQLGGSTGNGLVFSFD